MVNIFFISLFNCAGFSFGGFSEKVFFSLPSTSKKKKKMGQCIFCERFVLDKVWKKALAFSMLFEWDHQKNEKLKRERGISFKEIELAIKNNFVLDERIKPQISASKNSAR